MAGDGGVEYALLHSEVEITKLDYGRRLLPRQSPPRASSMSDKEWAYV